MGSPAVLQWWWDIYIEITTLYIYRLLIFFGSMELRWCVLGGFFGVKKSRWWFHVLGLSLSDVVCWPHAGVLQNLGASPCLWSQGTCNHRWFKTLKPTSRRGSPRQYFPCTQDQVHHRPGRPRNCTSQALPHQLVNSMRSSPLRGLSGHDPF